MAKACDECAQNCLQMHKRRKDPSSLVITFFKVMIGDDYAKILYLPPKFARIAKKPVGKTTLEDFNGEKWVVNFTKIDGHLAFKEGWNAFALYHGLQKGDFLVFHYIMKSRFVVLMYGSTGFPENRHFGFPMNETEKNNDKLIVNGQSSSKVHTNCNNISQSSAKSVPLVDGSNSMKTIDNKLKETNNQDMVATSSQLLDKETDQRSEPLLKNKTPDSAVADSSPTVKMLRLVDNGNRHERDEAGQRSEPLLKNTTPDSVVADSSPTVKMLRLVDNGNRHERDEAGQGSEPLLKNTLPDHVVTNSPTTKKPFGLVDNDNGHEQTETGQTFEPLSKNTTPHNMICDHPTAEKPSSLVDNSNGHKQDESRRNTRKHVVVAADHGQENNVAASGGGGSDDILQLPWSETRLKMEEEKQKEKAVAQNEVRQGDSTHKRQRPADVPIAPAKTVKTEASTCASRLHNSGYPFTSTRTPSKPMANQMEPKTTINHGSAGLVKKEPTRIHGSGVLIKTEPKPEPVDYEGLPPSGPSNTSFSAVMSNYEYLELPSLVKLKSNVLLLRNDKDLWAVLCVHKFGLKVLTQNWGRFAKEKGIKPGDTCEFVLESDPNHPGRGTCSVFGVRVTR